MEGSNLLPYDIFNHILYYASMPTYIKLCNINKTLNKICTNELWETKFKQNKISIKRHPTNFIDWMHLYHKYKVHVYKFVDQFMKAFNNTPYESGYVSILLENPLNPKNIDFREFTYKPIKKNNYKYKTIGFYYCKDVTNVYNHRLTYHQLRELICMLFKENFLNKNEKYFYNEHHRFVNIYGKNFRGF